MNERDLIAFALHVDFWAWDFDELIEDAVKHPNTLKSWQSMVDAGGKHSGDCTKECHMCQTCRLEELREDADRILRLAQGGLNRSGDDEGAGA